MKLSIHLREQKTRVVVLEVDSDYPQVHDLVRELKKTDATSFLAEDLAGVVDPGYWTGATTIVEDVFIVPE